MNYYNEIKEKIISCEVYDCVKDYSKERNRVITYYEIGKLLSKAGKEYGKNIIKQYSDKLVFDVGKKYNARTLRRIRQFYDVYSTINWSTMSTNLTWSHISELLSLKNYHEIEYYNTLCSHQLLSVRDLRNKIKSKEYERLDESTKEKLMHNEETNIIDLIPNPIVIKNTNKYENISEKVLQQMIIEDIPSFLEALGNGYSFIKNEVKIKIGNQYNYIDLLLYNYLFNSFIVIELKTTELKKEHIGQIQVYMNYIDKNLRTNEQNKTIGIIICKKDNKYIIEYSSDNRIITKEYLLI